jgi:hypothetical protein
MVAERILDPVDCAQREDLPAERDCDDLMAFALFPQPSPDAGFRKPLPFELEKLGWALDREGVALDDGTKQVDKLILTNCSLVIS